MEKQRMTMARRGLSVAIADNVEGAQDFSPSEVREADAELERRGAYTLTFFALAFYEASQQDLTNRCSEPLAVPMRRTQIMKTPPLQSTLALASGS
jgi:hypothetical protein